MTPGRSFRYERKFVPAGVGERELYPLLKTHWAMFSEAYPPRTVNNAYFDLIDLRSYADSVDGLYHRTKVRIRWYGDTFGEVARPKLEYKLKHGLLGRKLRFDLVAMVMPDDLDRRGLRKIAAASNAPADVRTRLSIATCTVINAYRRSYFVTADRRFRITIDTDLRVYARGRSRLRRIRRPPDSTAPVIVELKYDLEAEKEAHRITSALPFRLSKNSKYVTGIEKLYRW